MPDPIRITLPWPPSVNSMWRAVPRGKCCANILSAKGREYRERALLEIASQGETLRMLTGRLRVTLDLFPPTRRRMDVDNYSKASLDVLTHAKVWADDEQIDDLHILRCPVDRKNPRVIVTITEI